MRKLLLLTLLLLTGCTEQKLGADFVTETVDKGIYVEKSITEMVPDAGVSKVEMVKSEPKVILSKWDDEVRVGMKYKGLDVSGQKKVDSDVMEWKGAKEELHAYAIDENNYEIEVILIEKPSTNVFEFEITGAEDLDFFYQDELTAEAIADGASRPENVIGSYAVYHKEKSQHIEGGKNYATGKAFHIYRPKAIDADGDWVWAELSYFGSTLSVTVPQSFLNKATYPVKF